MGRKPGRKPTIVQSAKPPKKSSLTLNQIANKAAEEGLTYGEYVVKYGL